MEEFSAEYFKKLAHDIMFDLNDEEDVYKRQAHHEPVFSFFIETYNN